MSGLTAAESFLRSLLDLNRSKTTSSCRSVTVALSATVTPLASFKCKSVEFLGVVTLTLGGGSAVSYPGGIIPCNDASEILVSGSGSVSYIIYL